MFQAMLHFNLVAAICMHKYCTSGQKCNATWLCCQQS